MISGLNNYLYADYFGDIKAFSSYHFYQYHAVPDPGRLCGQHHKAPWARRKLPVAATAFTGAVYLVLFFLKLTNPWVYMISAAIGFLGVNYLLIW